MLLLNKCGVTCKIYKNRLVCIYYYLLNFLWSLIYIFVHAGGSLCFSSNTADFIKSAGAISSCFGLPRAFNRSNKTQPRHFVVPVFHPPPFFVCVSSSPLMAAFEGTEINTEGRATARVCCFERLNERERWLLASLSNIAVILRVSVCVCVYIRGVYFSACTHHNSSKYAHIHRK